MRFCPSIFASLLKPLDRRSFQAIVDRHAGDAYDKSFDSWDHLVALIFAQFSQARSLRGLVADWNASAHHHYHLGTDTLARSTFADANGRRPVPVFAETFAMLSQLVDRPTRRDGAQMLRLIDSTPVPLGVLCDCATWNGRIRGLKMHVVYDPTADHPRLIEITPANVNDVSVGRDTPLEADTTYVFDKGYCHYGWWTKIHDAGATFVTRPKLNARLRSRMKRPLKRTRGDGFRVVEDCEVSLVSKGDSKLPIPLRRIKIVRDNGQKITLLTNDMNRSAVEIGALYKARWQIELLFRWIKQNLDIRNFLGRNQNAIHLQIIAAMIAFLLLRLAARLHRISLPAIRFAELVAACLFVRKPLHQIHRPPPVNPSSRQPADPNQLLFNYA
ncbi:IS4 family transposase [Vineibacter terrae]|uniref:IS4 family transposase n=1 Tax=Vineibacter terrae TaxID=2586908 RepID=UPI002E31A37B|nr:IS4 family transposase [Vineibacter terrae]HEX2887574.1 IS4 family transposase [Vineibacter terrae]